jgi:parallel beta-helix repeat protein
LISGNHITKGGITVSRGLNNAVINNVIENGSNIKITWDTTNNIIENNYLISSGTIILDESTKTRVRFNTFKDSKGITISGNKLNHWNTHEIENNNINGKPIYSYKYRNNLIIPTDAAQVILANCQNIFMNYLNISNVDYGIQIINSTEVNVSSSNFIDNISNSIILLSSTDCNIYNNNIKNNFETGITIHGISSNNVIKNNDIINNKNGIVIERSTTNNIIRNNIIENNKGYAIYVKGSMNSIKKNNIKNNGKGIYLYFSYCNIIHKNNFIENGGKFAFFTVDYTRPNDNLWTRNYYERFRFLPKLVIGRIKTKYHWTDPYTFEEVYAHKFGLNFDWRPAKKPYDIEGVI